MITTHPIAGAHHPRACWVDLCQASTQEVAEAARRVGFALPDRAAIGEIEFSSRVRLQGEVLFLNVPRFQDDDGPTAPLGFAVSPTMLVTLREQRMGSLDAVAAQLQHAPCHSADDLLLRLFDQLVGRLADRLEALEAEITETTRQVFDDPRTNKDKTRELERLLHQVGGMGRRLGGMHNAGQGLLRLVTYLDGAAPDWFGADAAKRIGLLHKDLTTLGEFQQHLDDRIEFLLDSVLGTINMDQNNVMKVMAVASVVGIPPTVLVGIWGMNFAYMPELKWHDAYFWALGVIVLSMVVPLAWFRKRGWV
ncbi:CorA family divalent cation transporter [Xanthomonas campestris]|uniref:CorA family divalent cation transporter n=1 Tax=Xanthomonas campestris TaxID=339 RepID=UPI0008A55145|nr:CorA family divalent cation transporter [Xanthomonas campestris]MEB1151448.1 CorA family divalent cation transporter [Xanthomonas campestris pv. campestris]MCC5096857.1 magnesium transporter [Xanthomonas campestris]MEA9583942.1 CorA family divalent cation transporter [Xanthomonas campestris]MEA9591944.1 CorA family divalent cation transporter [Xanthomonas campestris]MEA9624021.1 CorA family divalent cation transporter [Xanthomonas campestris]